MVETVLYTLLCSYVKSTQLRKESGHGKGNPGDSFDVQVVKTNAITCNRLNCLNTVKLVTFKEKKAMY